MKNFLLPALLIGLISNAQLTSLPSGGNKKAFVGERVGLTDITIHYDRPAVKGREGKIWGELVHKGFIDQQFGSSKAAPWRAGANECTTIEFSTPVTIEGKDLPAGKYGLFIAYDPASSIIIFSKNSVAWGSYYYNEKEDALRVQVKPVVLDKSVERLEYQFLDQTENTATIGLLWEKLMIPFKVEVNYKQTQIESFRNELQTRQGFTWTGWDQAARWCVQNDINLEQALQWTDSSTGPYFGGEKNFQAWTTRAMVLEKLNRGSEAAEIMKKAMTFGNTLDIHLYGRQLLAQKKPKEALEVFKFNYNKNPKDFTTLVGMARGLSANNDLKGALKYATQALPLATDDVNRNSVLSMIDKLKAGKDANQ